MQESEPFPHAPSASPNWTLLVNPERLRWHQFARIERPKKEWNRIVKNRRKGHDVQPQSDFSIPEETVRVACAAYPKGNLYMQMRDAKGPTSSSWTPAIDHRKNEVIKIKFSTTDSRSCPRLTSCTSSQSPTPRRLITVRPRQQHEALQAARRREQTRAFAKQYARREGIEATISEARARL